MCKKLIFVLCMSLSFLLHLNTLSTQAQSPTEITLDGAKQIALNKIKGKIIRAKTEEDDGKTKYEIIIQAKDGTYEIEIDKATGKILEVEREGTNDEDDGDDNDDDRYDD